MWVGRGLSILSTIVAGFFIGRIVYNYNENTVAAYMSGFLFFAVRLGAILVSFMSSGYVRDYAGVYWAVSYLRVPAIGCLLRIFSGVQLCFWPLYLPGKV